MDDLMNEMSKRLIKTKPPKDLINENGNDILVFSMLYKLLYNTNADLKYKIILSTINNF